MSEGRGAIGWEEHPRRELLRLALPLSTALTTKAVVGVIDVGFVGTLGQEPLAGVGLGAVLHMLLAALPLGLVGALSIVTSQARGAGLGHRQGGLLGAGLGLAAGLCVGLGLLGWLVSGMCVPLSATEAAGEAAQAYLLIRLWEFPPGLAAAALRGFRHGLGDTRSPMVAAVLTALLNLVLDYLMVIRWGLGVQGAAWATVLAYAAQAIIMAVVQWRAPERPRWPLRRELASVWRLGLPAGLRALLADGVWVMLTVIVARFGSLDLAAHHVATWLLYLVLLPSRMIGEASAIMCGQVVGGERRELISVVARRALGLALGLYGVLVVGLIAAREPVASLFAQDRALRATIVTVVMVGGLVQLVEVAKHVARGILRGVGDVKVPAMVSIALLWTMTPPLVVLLGGVLGLGVVGAWIAILGESILTTAVLWRRVVKGRWEASADRSMADLRISDVDLE